MGGTSGTHGLPAGQSRGPVRGSGTGGDARGLCGFHAGPMRVRGLSLPPSLPMAGTGGTVDARGPIAEETKEPHGPGAALSLQGQEGAPRPPKRQRTRHRLAPAAPAAFIASSRAGCGTSLLGDLHPTDTPPGGLHPSASYHRSGGNHPTPRGKAQAREGPAPAGRGLRSGQGTRPPRGWGFWGASGPSQVSPARPRVLLTTGKKNNQKRQNQEMQTRFPPPRNGGGVTRPAPEGTRGARPGTGGTRAAVMSPPSLRGWPGGDPRGGPRAGGGTGEPRGDRLGGGAAGEPREGLGPARVWGRREGTRASAWPPPAAASSGSEHCGERAPVTLCAEGAPRGCPCARPPGTLTPFLASAGPQ